MVWSRLLLALGCAAACVRGDSEPCGELVCPGSLSCVTDGSGSHCIDHALIEACTGLATGALCSVQDSGSGMCDASGVCKIGFCGDGIVDPGEECDGTNLDGETCLNFCSGSACVAGGLSCTATCTYDTTGCVGACNGDGILGPGQVCNGSNLDGQTCEDFGYFAGTLSCTDTCTFNLANCSGHCGDGSIHGFEQCDGSNLGGASCESLGYLGSAVVPLTCGSDCSFAPGSCTCGGTLCTPNTQTCVSNGEIASCQ